MGNHIGNHSFMRRAFPTIPTGNCHRLFKIDPIPHRVLTNTLLPFPPFEYHSARANKLEIYSKGFSLYLSAAAQVIQRKSFLKPLRAVMKSTAVQSNNSESKWFWKWMSIAVIIGCRLFIVILCGFWSTKSVDESRGSVNGRSRFRHSGGVPQ